MCLCEKCTGAVVVNGSAEWNVVDHYFDYYYYSDDDDDDGT